jgi:hypothetical protein
VVEEAVEAALAPQRALDLLERAEGRSAELRPVALVETAEDVHPEAFPRRRAEPELRPRFLEQLCDLLLAHADEAAVDARLERLRPRLGAPLDGPPDDLRQARVALQPLDLGSVGACGLEALHELADRALLDALLAEDRQDVRDVVHEGRIGADDEDPPQLGAVRVEQERRAVQPDRGLPGAGAALDDERRRRGARDQAVLVGLNRRDDVAHARVTAALELLEQEVVDRRHVLERAAERLVADVDQPPALGAEAAPQRHAVRLRGRRGVEGARGGRLPVDDQHALLVVVDVAAPHVERLELDVDVDAAEAEASLRVGEREQPPRRPLLDRLRRDLADGDVGGVHERVARLVEVGIRPVDVGLLRREIWMRHRRRQPNGGVSRLLRRQPLPLHLCRAFEHHALHDAVGLDPGRLDLGSPCVAGDLGHRREQHLADERIHLRRRAVAHVPRPERA